MDMPATNLYHQDAQVSLLHGDCRPWLASRPTDYVDAIVTDSPYEMGLAAWDRTGVSFEVATWELCRRVLKPGGILANFALPKLYHRMATAVEDAGFEILDMAEWFYAQGKPSHPTRLKPGHESILLAMKPMSERTLDLNRKRWGVGGLWPEQAPIPAPGGRSRWPSNVFLSHADECENGCVPGCRVAELDAQSGIRKSGAMKAGTIRARRAGTFGAMAGAPMLQDTIADEGGASRFYFCSKVRGKDRLGHLSEKPEDLMEQLLRLCCPLTEGPRLIIDPFVGSGPTLEAARRLGLLSIGIELEREHCDLSVTRITRNAERQRHAS